MKLEGRNAVITGAGQGLGAAIAERFIAEGASVLLCARGEDTLRSVRRRLLRSARQGQKVLIHATDVAEPDQVDKLVKKALDSFSQLHILVNNAGVYGPIGAIEEVDWAEWTDAVRINLMGTVYACRAVLPHFKQQKYGKIVNLSGGGATAPLPRMSAYAASKAAVVRFTETLARETEDYSVDVNAIAPGALDTRLLDQVIAAGPDKAGAAFHERMLDVKAKGGTPLGTPASLCVYLGSGESDGISGKLVAALWDPWEEFDRHRDDLARSDVYTLRRIGPKDRGLDWGRK